MAKQKAAYPQMPIWASGDVWGFTHVELTDETMTIRVFSMPKRGSDPAQMTEVFSHSFANRVD